MQDVRLRTSLANAVVRLFRQVNRVHNRKLAAIEMSSEQAHILSILATEGPMTIGNLQKLLSLSSATLTGAVDRLEAQGLVRRVDSERDRRAYVLEHRLTSRQRERMERVINEGEAACFGALTAAERKELLRLLEKCSVHLEAEARAR